MQGPSKAVLDLEKAYWTSNSVNITYLLTGYPVRIEKYQARSHIVWTERSEVRATWLRA